MREPLLEVTIPPQIAMKGKHYHAGDVRAEKLIILKQAYDNIRGQENLSAVCRLFISNAGVRLIAVEGADKKVSPSRKMASVAELIGSSVSAGVLSLLSSEAGSIEVWGVDDLDLVSKSQRAMLQVNANDRVRERAFKTIRQLLHDAQSKFYPLPLVKLRAGMLNVYANNMALHTKTSLIKKVGAHVGLDLSAFPLIARLNEMHTHEARISGWRANRQLAKFVKRVVNRLFSWFKLVGKNQVQIDLQKAQPILEYWLEATGMTAKEFERNIEVHGMEYAFLDCKRWIETWIVEEARRQSQSVGLGTSYAFFEELMRLALRIGVPYFDLHDFRELIAINRDAEEVKAGLMDEITECCRLLVDGLNSPQATRLQHIEDQMDCLYRALRLEVPPEEAEFADIEAGKLIPLLEDLCQLTKTALPPAIMDDLRTLDQTLDRAHDFLEFSRHRSQHMVTKTLELMRERGEDRAILVVGGFHGRAGIRILEDHPEVSWSVIAPTPDLNEVKKRRP